MASAYDLVLNCEADEVLVVEPDDDVMKTASKRLNRLIILNYTPASDEDFCKIRYAPSVTDPVLLAEYDVILSCAPYAANPGLTKLALEAGVPFCDLGGNPETVAKQERLCTGGRRIPDTSIPVVPDCGVSPGLSNILAATLAKRGCDRIHVRCGGLPLDENQPSGMPDPVSADSGDFNYKLVFSPEGLLSEYSGLVPIIQEGRVLRRLAISTIEPFQWGECGLEASPTSNNSPQAVARLRDLGVKDYDYMTLRYPGHWDLVRGWMAAGFLLPCDPDGVRDGDEALATQLAANWRLKYRQDEDRDRLILSVQGSKGSGGLREHSGFSMEVWSDTKTGFTAMELTTSWGITTVAHQIASGVARPNGFATPEEFSDGDWIFGQIEKRMAQLEGQPE